MRRVLPSLDQVRDLELLLKAHHPLFIVETVEEERLETLLAYVADRLGLPFYVWAAHRGLSLDGGAPIAGTEDPLRCLATIDQSKREALYHLRGFLPFLEKSEAEALIKDLYQALFEHRGAIVLSSASETLPPSLGPLFTPVDLGMPTDHAYHQFVSAVLRDLKKRIDVEVTLTGEEVATLLQSLRGLTFFEVKKVITQAVIEDGRFNRDDLPRILEAKRQAIRRSGVLDYYPVEESLSDVAGLDSLKRWLQKRKLAFREPQRAERFGLSPPKGLLLLGVQGCGKSLCAKAVASEWGLPLIRLDPSTLYNKYYGESEKNLRRAMKTAESMAPIVLWIDEIEKAFGGQDGPDGGPSQRIFGTFLTWLNDKVASVFVIATANDVSKLPPELLRKGRFDEIFFVDLPSEEVRQRIFGVHLRRRRRDPADFDIAALSARTEGFSGAEIEQVVISALYTAFSAGGDLDDASLLREIDQTRPLSVTMAERIESLRTWAQDRAVPAS